MKKPVSVKFIQVVEYFFLALNLFLIVSGFVFLLFPGSPGGVYYELRAGFLSDYEPYSIREFGVLVGQLLIPLILIGLNLVFLQKRKYKSLIVVLILQIIKGISMMGLSTIFNFAFLLLILLDPNAKQYLKGSGKVTDQTETSL